MLTLDLGDIAIQRVIEVERWAFAGAELLPGLSDELVLRAKEWLDDRFIDSRSNQLILQVHSYVVRTPRHTILIDTCNGNDKERPNLIAHHRLETRYLEELAKLGLKPADIDVVMCTHLHPDHCGWNTRLADGKWVPTFPNARYLMSRADHDFLAAIKKSEPTVAVLQDFVRMYDDSVLPVIASGQAQLVETDHVVEHEVGSGVWLEGAPGHTPGHFAVHAKTTRGHAIMVGDAIYHPVQLNALDIGEAGDADARISAVTRRRLVNQHTDTGTYFLAAHFPTPTFGRIVSHASELRMRWLDEES
jgi:glyoxylase-like metal-dependent hydrolase (beta-lactamase superfamily II)